MSEGRHEEMLTTVVEVNPILIIALVVLVIVLVILLVRRSNVAEEKAARGQELISAAEHDNLTGLYNENFFFEYASRIQKENKDKKMDALAVDLENFHAFNVLNGREHGDVVLKALADIIKDFLEGTTGIGSRIEADRFYVFCEQKQDYQAVLSDFQNKLDEQFKTADLVLRIGVMPYKEGLDPVEMFERAWSACTIVRGSNKTHLFIYNDEIRKRVMFEQQLKKDLITAIDNGDFTVMYQPKYNIQTDPPVLSSAEALVRWVHPTLGRINPSDFIPLFEKSGQIGIIDRYVWRHAANQIAVWKEKYGVDVSVSVNMSKLDMMDPGIDDVLSEIISEAGIERNLLKLEMTESTYVENEATLVDAAIRLREKGYEIEMDDFGCGYSSLNMLSTMPIDVLKMDKAFVENIEHNEKDMKLVELILNIAKNLDVPVVAEGVETENQSKLLKDAGCSIVQGYYYSGPLQAEEFEQLLSEN